MLDWDGNVKTLATFSQHERPGLRTRLPMDSSSPRAWDRRQQARRSKRDRTAG